MATISNNNSFFEAPLDCSPDRGFYKSKKEPTKSSIFNKGAKAAKKLRNLHFSNKTKVRNIMWFRAEVDQKKENAKISQVKIKKTTDWNKYRSIKRNSKISKAEDIIAFGSLNKHLASNAVPLEKMKQLIKASDRLKVKSDVLGDQLPPNEKAKVAAAIVSAKVKVNELIDAEINQG